MNELKIMVYLRIPINEKEGKEFAREFTLEIKNMCRLEWQISDLKRSILTFITNCDIERVKD